MREARRIDLLERRVTLLEERLTVGVVEELLALVADLLQTQTLILRHLLEEDAPKK
jgi:hypothetical protein